MAMLLRHLAATLLPLASTAAGVVAVGVAVQLPSAPSLHLNAPVVAAPVASSGSPVAVVRAVGLTSASKPKPRANRPVVSRPIVIPAAGPLPVRPTVTTTAPETSIPVSNLKPPTQEDAAPSTPAVTEPAPAPAP